MKPEGYRKLRLIWKFFQSSITATLVSMDATISSKIEVRLIILLVGYHQMMIRWELTCDALKQEKSVDSSSSTGALSMLLKKRC